MPLPVYERSLITAPTVEPITLTEAKAHLNVDFTDDDTKITGFMVAAREHVEDFCSRAIITQSWEVYPQQFPCEDFIRIPLGKLQNITSFSYVNSAGDTVSWTVSGTNLLNESGVVNAHIDKKSDQGKIKLAYGKYWPVAVLKTSNPITIGFDCGYGLAASVPSPIRQAILLLTEQWYKNRDIAPVGKSLTVVELPYAVEALLSVKYRLPNQ